MMYVGRYGSRYFRVHEKNISHVPKSFVVFTNRKAVSYYAPNSGRINKPFIACVELKTPEDFELFRNKSKMNIDLLFGMYNGI
jgi:hypothetical protein